MKHWQGRVVHIDRFGNVVTNIRATQLPHGEIVVEVADTKIHGLSATFADAGMGSLRSSAVKGTLEIAENLC